MIALETVSPDVNFWETETGQQFKITNPFKRLYQSDRSEERKDSSMMMWFITLCYNQYSIYEKLETQEKHELIGLDFLGNANYYDDNEDTLNLLIDAYVALIDTPAKRALKDWEVKMGQRARFIRDTDYTLDYYEEDSRSGRQITKKGTADQLDKMMERTKKLFDLYQQILKDLSTEEDSSGVMGGEMESLNDD